MNEQGSSGWAVTVSTASLPAPERLPVWREVFGQKMVRLDIEAMQDAPFHAEGTFCALPGAALASVTATPVRIARSKRLIADDIADMAFIVTADAPLHIAQCGKEHVLDAGDAIFLRGAEYSAIRSQQRTRFTNISVPADALAPFLGGCADLSMTVVPGQSDLLGLLLGYADLIWTRSDPSLGAFGPWAANHIRDLIAAIARHQTNAPDRAGVRAARLQAIKAEIERRLSEADLTVDSVAARHGISTRYLRKLFHETETTFTDFVLSRRLDLAHRMLVHPEQSVSTIAAVAHDCGFGDLSYFNRTFRRRFEMTPTDLRADTSGLQWRRSRIVQ